MTIRVCVAGATGWAGSAVTGAIIASASGEFQLVGGIARREAGRDIGEVLDLGRANVKIAASVEEALAVPADVLIDYTGHDVVKGNILTALDKGVRVVVGTSGLTASDYTDIEQRAMAHKLGVIAAGNFSITAALAKHFSLIAAQYLPSWEIIDYASAAKIDAPSGTTRELAEELAAVSQNHLEGALEQTHGPKEARGATIEGTQVHSIRLPGYVIAFEMIFGLPEERLSIRHDAGSGAGPYVSGTLLATRKVLEVSGLVRGLDRLLFQ
jgi:4-hydroxy-tetrahydrodipicolinate reductase